MQIFVGPSALLTAFSIALAELFLRCDHERGVHTCSSSGLVSSDRMVGSDIIRSSCDDVGDLLTELLDLLLGVLRTGKGGAAALALLGFI